MSSRLGGKERESCMCQNTLGCKYQETHAIQLMKRRKAEGKLSGSKIRIRFKHPPDSLLILPALVLTLILCTADMRRKDISLQTLAGKCWKRTLIGLPRIVIIPGKWNTMIGLAQIMRCWVCDWRLPQGCNTGEAILQGKMLLLRIYYNTWVFCKVNKRCGPLLH